VQTSVAPLAELASHTDESGEAPTIKILAYNIAKGFVHEGGVSFANEDDLRQRMEKIAQLINDEQPDLVFLSEAILECGPTPVNQVEFLAEKTGMATWAFGENFNFGLPGYRITSGNAILSRAELTPVTNLSLAGRQPFYVTKNNRRVLFCRTKIAGRDVLLGSIHTDSFNLESNLAQTKQILEFCGSEPAILAGDFNCRPDEPSIPYLVASGQFVGSIENILTFPAHQPDRRLDYIFAPASWELVEERILPGTASDHRAVVATFVVKW
jgi:endonuclease/exonuclease/phosphatase family metal-dependent hydrolase